MCTFGCEANFFPHVIGVRKLALDVPLFDNALVFEATSKIEHDVEIRTGLTGRTLDLRMDLVAAFRHAKDTGLL